MKAMAGILVTAVLIGAMGVGLSAGGCCGQNRSEQAWKGDRQGEGLAVGQVDRRELLMAYYRSERFQRMMADLHRQHDEAVRAGDAARVAALNRQGEALQDRAHRQLEGTEPLDALTADVQDVFAAVAESRHLSRIEVTDRPTTTRDGTRIDITKDVVERLRAK